MIHKELTLADIQSYSCALYSLHTTACNYSSCCCLIGPKTRISSNKQTRLCSKAFVLFWNSSGAHDINLLKQYLPNGDQMVKWPDTQIKEICQNPLLTSNLVKQVAPASWAKVSSTLGCGWIWLITLIDTNAYTASGLRDDYHSCAPWGRFINFRDSPI